MKKTDLFQKLVNDSYEFKGWDFGYLTKSGRMQSFPLNWNYTNLILPFLKNCETLLDMGTGGGEFLATLQPLPQFTYATECYKPNVQVAKDTLEPLGPRVVELDNQHELPFKNNFFDLVINRHEEFSSLEVKRILKNGGYFITQQVGGLSGQELNTILNAPPYTYCDFNFQDILSDVLAAKLKVKYKNEQLSKTRFYDIESIVYYLKAIPWQLAGFSIDKYIDELYNLHQLIKKKGYFDITSHRFVIVATK